MHFFPVVFIKYLRVQSKHEILRMQWTNEQTTESTEIWYALERNQLNLFKLLLSHTNKKNASSTGGCSCAAIQYTQHNMALEYIENVLLFLCVFFCFSLLPFSSVWLVCVCLFARERVFCSCCVDIVIYLFEVVVSFALSLSLFLFVYRLPSFTALQIKWHIIGCC